MVKEIDPLHPANVTEEKVLYDFFNTDKREFWQKGTILNADYILGCEVLKRRRVKNAQLMSGYYRYECYDQGKKFKLGKDGSFITESKGAFHIEEQDKIIQPPHEKPKERLVKVQIEKIPITDIHIATKANMESEKTPHRKRMKPTVTTEEPSEEDPNVIIRSSFSVLRKFPGHDLFHIIERDHIARDLISGDDPTDKGELLSLDQRMALTKMLLQAYKEQVSDEGLIHWDIKPENIIVDLSQDPMAIEIVDYESAEKIGMKKTKKTGTISFAAPELFYPLRDEIQTAKLDIYSLGRVLFLLWGVPNESYSTSDKKKIVGYLDDMNGLFENIDVPGGEEEFMTGIIELLLGMLHQDPNLRWDIDKAIDHMNDILKNDTKRTRNLGP